MSKDYKNVEFDDFELEDDDDFGDYFNNNKNKEEQVKNENKAIETGAEQPQKQIKTFEEARLEDEEIIKVSDGQTNATFESEDESKAAEDNTEKLEIETQKEVEKDTEINNGIMLSKKEQKKLQKQQAEEAKKQAELAKKQAEIDKKRAAENAKRQADEAKKQAKLAKRSAKKNKGKQVETKQEPEENLPKTDMKLYILIDSGKNGLLSYLRGIGLNVSGLSNKVEDARGYLLRQSEPTRVVIVDSGTGKFVTTSIRKDIVDMLGTTDENLKFTVFYTDSGIKSDAIYELGETAQEIEWIEYKSSIIFAAIMLKHNENYIYGNNLKDREVAEPTLNFKGVNVAYKEDFDDDRPILINSAIAGKMAEYSSSDLMGFEPHI